jgi:hypothetical protein
MNPLVELLVRLRALLERVPDAIYVSRPAPALSGSIGEHVRHCLDHVAVLVAAHDGGPVCYDRRLRFTTEETSRGAAIARIDALIEDLLETGEDRLWRPVVVESLLHADGLPVTADSSLGRELAFVVHHTIHHFAVIALLLDRQGLVVPPRFAHAPSTLKAA